MRRFQNNFCGDIGMPVRRDKNGEAWRREERCYELPGRWSGPWAPHYPGMRGYAQKLIEYSPRSIPGIRPRTLAFKPIAARMMKLGVNIGGINKHVGVDDKHQLVDRI